MLTQSIFYQLFELINENIFSGAVTFDQVEAWMPLIVGTICAFATVLLVALPFFAVYTFCKWIFSGCWARF